MEELQRAVSRLEELAFQHAERLTKMEAGAVNRDALLSKIDGRVEILTAAHNVSKGLKILGSLGLTTVAGAIGVAVTTWFSKQ